MHRLIRMSGCRGSSESLLAGIQQLHCGFSVVYPSRCAGGNFYWRHVASYIKVNKWIQELIQSEPHQAPNNRRKERQIQLSSHRLNRWQALGNSFPTKTLNYNIPPLSCRGQITLSNIDEICPIANPNEISLISLHVPSLVKIPWHLHKLSSGNDNMGVSRADSSVKILRNSPISNP